MSVTRGTLAFLGTTHVKKFTEFRYVEVVSVSDDTTTVKTVGPDDDLPVETLDVPSNVIGFRAVSDFERHLWPGSYVSHPVAFVRTSAEGVDLWSYGVVSGYTSSDNTSTLHVVSAEGPVRLPLTDPYSAIKMDPLNYALQTGGEVNATSCTPLELLHQQNETVAACNKKKSGIPAAVISSLAIAFDGDAVVPLVKPTSLQLVHVRRQHIVDFVTTARTKRPRDLYNDPSATVTSRPTVSPQGRGIAHLGSPGRRDTMGNKDTRSVQVRLTEAEGTESDELDYDGLDDIEEDDVHDAAADGNSDSEANEVEDINAVRQMNRSLSKRHRTQSPFDSDNELDLPESISARQNGIAFRPPPTDRKIHAAIVNKRHTGKVSQTLLQSIQQAPYVEFLPAPAVLQGLYSFGFGLGLSIMHCKRVLLNDEVAAEERGVNLWDFSAKNSIQPPAKANSFADIICALATLHKFAQEFYNPVTADFIATTRDFMINYNDRQVRPVNGTPANVLGQWQV